MATRTDLLLRRERRLDLLDKSHVYERVRRGVSTVHSGEHGSRSPAWVNVRPAFVGSSSASPTPHSAELIKSRGLAQQFYLLALFEAQCRLAPGARWTNPRAYSYSPGDEVTWLDLVAVDVDASKRTLQKRTAETNRKRQLDAAIRTLTSTSLVEVPTYNGRRAIKEFSLMTESGRGSLATPNVYSVPSAAESLQIPAEFWLNGWLAVLHPSEIATWLMLRHLRHSFPGEHDARGVYVYGQDREDRYSLTRDAYEAHIVLERLGLIRCLTKISFAPDFMTLGSRDQYDPHRFQVTDAGLQEMALPRVMKHVRESLALAKANP